MTQNNLPDRSATVPASRAVALFAPLAKLLVGAVPPVRFVGLLYLGSGVGLLAWWPA